MNVCGNWDRGRTIPFLGTHKFKFQRKYGTESSHLYPNLVTSVKSSWNHFNWGRNCKSFKKPRNRFPAWWAGTTNLFVVPALQATKAGAIDSSESIPGPHKRLQIRALSSFKWPMSGESVRPVPEHRRGLRVPGGLGEVLLHDHLAHPLHPLLPLHPPPLRTRPRHPATDQQIIYLLKF